MSFQWRNQVFWQNARNSNLHHLKNFVPTKVMVTNVPVERTMLQYLLVLAYSNCPYKWRKHIQKCCGRFNNTNRMQSHPTGTIYGILSHATCHTGLSLTNFFHEKIKVNHGALLEMKRIMHKQIICLAGNIHHRNLLTNLLSLIS